MVVAVPLLDLRLAGGEVRADEAERRAVEAEADGDGALVAGGAAQTRLDRLHAHVSVSNYTRRRVRTDHIGTAKQRCEACITLPQHLMR